MVYRLLILEDDIEVQKGLKEILEIKGYQVDIAGSVAEFDRLEMTYDMYMLDIVLPDGTGFEVCEHIRKKSEAPVLFITSCDDQDSIIKGLDIGADDYITKPFYTAELMSRIQANLRRIAKKENKDIYKKDNLTVYLNEYRAEINGEEIKLTHTEFEILKLLITNKGLIVKREVLFERIWDCTGKFVEDNTLTVAISRLKSKLGTFGSENKSYIENIRNVGYRWRE